MPKELTNEEIYALLEMRGEATQGKWILTSDGLNVREKELNKHVAMTLSCEPFTNDDYCRDNAAYIVAMHNSFEDLCRMALERNKYKEAAEELEKALNKAGTVAFDMDEVKAIAIEDFNVSVLRTRIDAALAAYHAKINE